MRNFEKVDAVNKVREELRKMGLDFPVDMIKRGDRNNEQAVVVTYGKSIFGKHIETLDKYFNHDLFMRFFKSRLNYLKLTPEERANIFIHPQEWEQEFLATQK
jgi:hypothetical protein